MKKVYHLKTCATCRRILDSLDLSDFVLRDLKNRPVTEEELDELRQRSGSYESLFNRKSRKYRQLDLHTRKLDEADYKRLMLQEYTLLARPVFLIDDHIFVGSQSRAVDALEDHLATLRKSK